MKYLKMFRPEGTSSGHQSLTINLLIMFFLVLFLKELFFVICFGVAVPYVACE